MSSSLQKLEASARPSNASVRQAREISKLDREAGALRPSEALPRRLQACMQELLSVNERYHELLQASDEQRSELEAAREELARLRPAHALLETKFAHEQVALRNAEKSAEDFRAAHELQAARITAVEAERDDLHKVVQAYAERLLQAESALGVTEERTAQAENWLTSHWQAGYEEGVAQQKKEMRQKLLQVKTKASQEQAQAFERGQAVSNAAASTKSQREEAERRLLLKRAEEARTQQKQLARQLESERVAREAVEGKARTAQARLAGMRHEKASLANELKTARAAHTADLEHFDQMENALGLACAEYSSLAAKHARAISPPRGPRNMGANAFGSSPADEMRAARPRPAAVGDDGVQLE